MEPTAEGREISTTQAYVRFLTQLLRDQALGPRVVPILVDEARTFGMEGLFRQIGIYNPAGPAVHPGRQGPGDVLQGRQGRPDPAGRHQRGWRHGQLDCCGHQLQHQQPHHGAVLCVLLDVRLPAHRRPGLGGGRHAGARLPAGRHLGRTTLNGEGLQHEDGHSHIMAGTIPNCISYDPTFAHEVASSCTMA
jgi:pyruvate dehydrogenase E1 component